MADPIIHYNGKTVEPGKLWSNLTIQPRQARTIQTSLSGRVETTRLPRMDNFVRVEWRMLESVTIRRQLHNFWQWAQRGEPWALALDADKTVDTRLAVEATKGDAYFYVDDPAGITAGQIYRVMDGSHYQAVTIDTIAGDRVAITETLDCDFGAGAIVRDQFFFLGSLRDDRSPAPIEEHPADVMQNFPTSIRFSFALEFHEDVSLLEDEMLFKALSANDTGVDSASAQPWFPTDGEVEVAENTLYEFEGYLRTSRGAGTTSHTTSILFAGTATLTSIAGRAHCNTGDTVANITENGVSFEVATATVVKAASTSATEQTAIRVRGVVRINAAGSFIPQFQYSSAPGGAPTVLANSWFMLRPLGSGSATEQGTWSE